MRRPPARGREDLLLSPIRETRSGSPIREVPPRRAAGTPAGASMTNRAARLNDARRVAIARALCVRETLGHFSFKYLGHARTHPHGAPLSFDTSRQEDGQRGGAGGFESREMRSQATRNLLLLGGGLLGDRLLRLRREEGGARRENRAIWRGGRRGKRRSLLERAEIGRGKARGVRAARNFVRAVRRAGWGASPMRFGVGARARVAREI